MSTLSVTTKVNAPIERVFALFTEIDKAAERIPQITELVMLSEGPVGKGTRWRETRVIMKKEATEEMWITDFQPPKSYKVEANSHGMLYETLFQFEPEDDGTRVTWVFNGTPQTFGAKLTAPIFNLMFKGIMTKCMQGDVDALKAVAEA